MSHLHYALEAFEEHSLADTPQVLVTMGEIFLAQQDYLRANQFISFAIDQAQEKGIPAAEVQALQLKAQAEAEKGITPQAMEDLQKALELSEAHRLDQYTLDISRKLLELHQKSEDYQGACQYSKRVMELNQEIIHRNTISEIKAMELSKELQKTKDERDSLNKRISFLEESCDQIRSIGKLGEEVNALMNLDLVIDTVYTKLQRMLPMDAFGVLLYNQEEQELCYRYQIISQRYVQSAKPISLNNRSSIEACCARTRKPLLISDVEAEGHIYRGGPVSDAQNQFRSWMLIPLEARNEMLGVLSIQAEQEGAFSVQDMDLLKMLANQIAVATANFRTLEDLQAANETLKNDKHRLHMMNRELQDAKTKIEQLAIYDDLTGLPNRHLLYERALPMLHLAKRNRSPFAVCFIDIDNFKQINDSLGHWAGDEALRILGRRISRSLRKSDLVARLGGDEFVAVFNDLKRKESILIIMEKLIKEISSPLGIGRHQFIVSASIGVSFYPEDASEFTDLLNLADKAQYAAKHEGKNRYLLYSQLMKQAGKPSQDAGIS